MGEVSGHDNAKISRAGGKSAKEGGKRGAPLRLVLVAS